MVRRRRRGGVMVPEGTRPTRRTLVGWTSGMSGLVGAEPAAAETEGGAGRDRLGPVATGGGRLTQPLVRREGERLGVGVAERAALAGDPFAAFLLVGEAAGRVGCVGHVRLLRGWWRRRRRRRSWRASRRR